MASRCLFVNSISSTLNNRLSLTLGNPTAISIRWKGRGSPGQSQGKRRMDRDFRLKYNPGTYVKERTVLCTQRYLDYHPGLNTSIMPVENCIHSLRSGRMIVTTEPINPDMSHEICEKYYKEYRGPMFKRFIHVIPEKQTPTFKLIDLV